VDEVDDHGAVLSLRARRFVYGVRVRAPGFVPQDDGFSLEPGHERRLCLPRLTHDAEPDGWVTALNLSGRVAFSRAAVTR
jgi:hypothetical protein